eukprot:12320-Heterococcus_DN1.PRE.10
MVQWLQQQRGVQKGDSAMCSAASCGQIGMCAHLHSQQYVPMVLQLSKFACDSAAGGGHIDTLSWLHEHGCA